MVSIKGLWPVLLVSIFVSACDDITVTNGEIPPEAVESVRPYTGTYSGQFAGVQGRLQVILEGRRLRAEFIHAGGAGFLEPGCESNVGLLQAISGRSTGSSFEVQRAEFAFSAGRCAAIEGKKLNLDVERRDGRVVINAQILSHQELRKVCQSEFVPGVGFRETCEFKPVPVSLMGEFSRLMP